jgi:CelD/BcsL family acetyltransferase involved in cellulose biosynthesis
VYVIKVGFDPALAHTGVGKILLGRMIEDSFRRGDHTIDLGPESLHYKRFWLTSVQTSYRVVHYAAASPKAQALRLARWARGWMTGGAIAAVAEAVNETPAPPLAVSQ